MCKKISTSTDKEVRLMKLRRSDIRRQAHVLPVLKFESQSLTSYAGLVLFQQLFAVLELKDRLRGCFRSATLRVLAKRLSLSV